MAEPRFSTHIRDTAPADTILDPDDMAEIRSALRAGYRVGLTGDGKVYTNHKLAGDHEPDGQPMSDQQQAYVESRLGDVRNLVREGWNVSIQPDGKILANPPGNTNDRYFAGPDRTIDDEEMAWIDNAIRNGHQVHVYPDRSVLVVEHEAGAPDASGSIGDREALVRQFHDSLSTMQADLDAGKQIVVSRDGALGTHDVDGNRYLYPADDEAPPTLRNADALDEEAAKLRAQAEQLHEASRTLTKEIDTRGAQADQLDRDVEAARATSRAAQERADVIQNEANDTGQRSADYDAKADELAGQGREVEAEEYREVAASLRARQVSLTERAEASHQAAVEATTRADTIQQQIPDRITWNPQAVPAENVADQLDDKARLLEEAAASQRAAAREDAEDDPGAASGSRNYAKYVLEKADATQPDFDKLDAAELQRQGIDVSNLPLQAPATSEADDPVGDQPSDQPSDQSTDSGDDLTMPDTDTYAAPDPVDDQAGFDDGSAYAMDDQPDVNDVTDFADTPDAGSDAYAYDDQPDDLESDYA